MKWWDIASRTLHGRVLYPAVIRAVGEGTLFARLRELETSQWDDPQLVRGRQEAQLAAALTHAYARCEFYRERWPARPPRESAAAVEYLRTLPFVDKAHLQTYRASLMARPQPARTSAKVTGGSTGQAVTVVKDRAATARERAAMWRGYSWYGVTPGDRAARYWGAPFAARRRFVTTLGDRAMNRIRFSAFAFDEADLGTYWERTRAFKPDYLHGYVSMLEALARFVLHTGAPPDELRLKSVIATSEVLTAPQREVIETAFRAPVQIEYGCGEVGPIAYECREGSLHLMIEDLFIELLDDQDRPVGPGVPGHVVITDLNNRAMPLIRYRIGDFAVPGGRCTCRRTLPTIAAIWGRAYDFVNAPDGRRYHGEFFMYLFEDLRQAGLTISAFQVVQDAADHLTVALVTPDFGQVRGAVTSLLSERLPGFRITVGQVNEIPRTGSGKMRLVRNALADQSAPPAVAGS